MTKLLSLIALCSLFAAPVAMASPQTHHCELNGAEIAKTKKECHKAGGKWEKGAPAGAAASPAATKGATPPPAPSK